MQSPPLALLCALALSPLGVAQQLDWLDRVATNPPTARNEGAVVYDVGRGVVVRFGGYLRGVGVTTDETWELQGFQWTQRTPAMRPLARTQSAAVYDIVAQRTLLFGGWLGPNQGLLNDTWSYDGTTWTQLNPPTSPPLTHEHAMAYDMARNVVVMFGGICTGGSGNALTNATWEFANGTWTQQTPTASPIARSAMPMVYDPARQRMVVFSGSTGSGISTTPQDTWEYDGTTWTQIVTPTSPLGRCEHAMVYDQARNRVVIHGGAYMPPSSPSPVFLGDTWEYDGANWTQITVPNPPTARWGITTVFDPVWNLVVRVGSQWPGSTTVGYFGTIVRATASDFGTACPGSTTPLLGTSIPRIGTTVAANLVSARGSAMCMLGLAVGPPTPTPLGPCTLYLPTSSVTMFGTTNSFGFAPFSFYIPDSFHLVGVPLVAQAFVEDPGNAIGIAATKAKVMIVGL